MYLLNFVRSLVGHESLLGSKVKKEKKGAGSPVTSGRDELELYLADPEEPHIEVDVLACHGGLLLRWNPLGQGRPLGVTMEPVETL